MTRRTRLLLLLAALAVCGCQPAPGPAGNNQQPPAGDTDNAETTVPSLPESPAEAAGNAAEPPDGAEQVTVVAEMLPYAEVGNELVYGHFVFPADMVDPLPGLIVIHEWRGLDDTVRSAADRIAAEGYVVLAVDLFRGQSAATESDARPLMIEVVENPELANQNLRQAYEFLSKTGQSPRIGALGWDFGGGWALNSAMLLPGELDAAVIYYGQVTTDPDRLNALDVPILGLFGEDDPVINADAVRAFDQAMEQLGKNCEVEIYPGVAHSFASPVSPDYNAEVAGEAWARTAEFLERYLSTGAN